MSAKKDHSHTNASNENKPQKNIFIVDDHPIVRMALAAIVEGAPDLAVCGQAGTVSEAIEAIARFQPDLVITDIIMPGRSGLDLISHLKITFPQIDVLAISAHDETVYAERVLRAGGRGYISKHEKGTDILLAVRQLLSGQVHFSTTLLHRLFGALAGRAAITSDLPMLSVRELEVLRLLGAGKDSHAIAAELRISVKTAHVHRQHLREKLCLKTGKELVCYAVRWLDSNPIQASLQSSGEKVVR